MKFLSIFCLMMILTSCTVFSQSNKEELDTTFLYIPYKVFFETDSTNFSNSEKTNLNYIFDNVIAKGYDSTNLFILSVDHCPDELLKDEYISYKRINSILEYLVNEKGIDRYSISFIYGENAPSPSCKRMGVLINTRKKQ